MTDTSLSQYSHILHIPPHHLSRHPVSQLAKAVRLQNRLSDCEENIEKTQDSTSIIQDYVDEHIVIDEDEPLTTADLVFELQQLRNDELALLETRYQYYFLMSCFGFHEEEPDKEYDEAMIAIRWEIVRKEAEEEDEAASKRLGELLGADMSLLERHWEFTREREDYIPLLEYKEEVLSYFSLDFLAFAYRQKVALQGAENELEDAKKVLSDMNNNWQYVRQNAISKFHKLFMSSPPAPTPPESTAKTEAVTRYQTAEENLRTLSQSFKHEITQKFHLVSQLLNFQADESNKTNEIEADYRDAFLEHLAYLFPNGQLPWPAAITDSLSLEELARILRAREKLSEAEFMLEHESDSRSISLEEADRAVHDAKERFWELTKSLWDAMLVVENEKLERDAKRVVDIKEVEREEGGGVEGAVGFLGK